MARWLEPKENREASHEEINQLGNSTNDHEMQNANTRRLVEDELRTLRIGVQLAKLRQKAGMTQAQLAAKVGMSPPNISRIESSPGQTDPPDAHQTVRSARP